MKDMTLEVLQKAREIISKPENWIQDDLAINAENESVYVEDAGACKFCSIGACLRASYELRKKTGSCINAARSDLAATLRARGLGESVAMFNDNHTHAEVLTLFDEAIERARKVRP